MNHSPHQEPLNKQQPNRTCQRNRHHRSQKQERKLTTALHVGVNRLAQQISGVDHEESSQCKLEGDRKASHLGKIDDDRVDARKRSEHRADDETGLPEDNQAYLGGNLDHNQYPCKLQRRH